MQFFSDAERQVIERKRKKLKSEEIFAENAAILQSLILEIEANAKGTFEYSEVFQLIATKLTALFGRS